MFEMMADLKAVWGRLRQEPDMSQRVQRSPQEHADIVRALREREPESAGNLMRKHLNNVRKSIFGVGEYLQRQLKNAPFASAPFEVMATAEINRASRSLTRRKPILESIGNLFASGR